jgi:hypothetical protein
LKTYESNNLRLKSAQAVSDKLEVMRDRATYESTVTDSLKIQKKFENIYWVVMKCKKKVCTY